MKLSDPTVPHNPDGIMNSNNERVGISSDLSRVHIAIPVKNNFSYTASLVATLIDQGEIQPHQIHIYDNGSDDGTPELIAPFGVTVIDASDWRLHRMWNAALEMNSGSPVVILNNDISIGSKFISSMADALQIDPELAVVCPNYDDRDGDIIYVSDIQAGRMDGSGGIAGWAYMVAADWANSFRFPEELRWWYGDNVLVDSVAIAGRKCAIVGGTTVIHLDGGSRTGQWTVDMVEPDRIWYEKWRAGLNA